MKTMTCKQLGGACDIKFQAETFGEISELSMQHSVEMMEANDEAHLKAMTNMKEIMQHPATMNQWFLERKAEFDALPED